MISSASFRRHRQSGIALILVLSILVLLTAVVVAFFTNSTTDLTSSKGYSNEAQVKLLANSAVNMVEGQIRAATAGTDPSVAGTIAWASQPGLIRTYSSSGNNAYNVAQYKLYSSDEMQVRSGDVDGEFPLSPVAAESTEIPTNWNTLPSDFTDLNSPEVIPDPDGTLTDANGVKYSARYPIIDGNNLGTVSGVNGMTYVNSNGAQTIAGFTVQTPATYNAGAPAPVVAPNNNPVPMPVRWLYQLQDGQLSARNPRTGIIPGTSPTASQPAGNPVVGRVAFWTDDDTCKLNINTASEGTAWDSPRAKTATDVKNSLYIPAQNEFQMFPGHPAKNCLSTVFNSKWPVPTADLITNINDYNLLLPYYDLAPRISSALYNSTTQSQGSAGATQFPSATGIVYDADRLYASVDELMFTAASPSSGPPPVRITRNVASNIPGGGATAAVDPAFLETTRFFLTASNRAPEVTLFNTPRISLWPIQVTAATAKDQLLSFCTTIPTSSRNASSPYPYVYYLQRLTLGQNNTSPSCLSPTMDYAGTAQSCTRNQNLYTYLQNLTSNPVPGLGGTLSGKYPTGAYQQLLTEIFDQIRSGVNTTGSTTNGLNNGYSYTTYGAGYGEVVPLTPPINTPGYGTQGFGRFPTITEAALDMFLLNPTPSKGDPVMIGAVLLLQPFNVSPGFPDFTPEFQVEVTGLGSFNIQPTGNSSLVKGLGLPNDGVNIVTYPAGGISTGSSTEYNTILMMFIAPNGSAKNFNYNGSLPANYPFYNNPPPPSPASQTVGNGELPNGTTNFDLIGGTIQIKISPYYTGATALQPVQTLTMTFPSAYNLPVPTNTVSGTTASVFQSRITQKTNNMNGDGEPSDQCDIFAGVGSALLNQYDVVRSVIVDPKGPSKGDYRVIAALKSVNSSGGSNYFTAHPFYDNYDPKVQPKSLPGIDPGNATQDIATNWRFAESLRTGENPGYGELGYNGYSGNAQYYLTQTAAGGFVPLRKSAYAGPLVAGLKPPASGVPPYGPEAAPAVPVGTTGAFLADGTTPGDWDSGLGILEDGPYINKPDEGNVATLNSSAYAKAKGDQAPEYNRGYTAAGETGSTYSPNRQVSSAVIFGSLPTGIDPTGSSTIQPWQTLLFCAYPPAFATTGNAIKHPGFGTPLNSTYTTLGLPAPPYKNAPDHVLLDCFTMPIVEPYAISEPLSTQGKVNMNYQIAPFTYIRRDTALQAVLRGTKMMAIPSSPAALSSYKTDNTASNFQYRYSINPDETSGTLAAFEERFKGAGSVPADIFRSASEICTVPLVPSPDTGQNYDPSVLPAAYSSSAMQAFWNSCKLTGDNLREEPYGDLYARLTTKSNTFTVHVRVQTLKKSAGTNVNTFVDPTDTNTTGAKDTITGEYRGSYQIERYVDPNVSTTATATMPAFPDYVTAGLNATPISTFYKFHTIGTKQF